MQALAPAEGGRVTPRAGAGQRNRSQGKGDGGAQAKYSGPRPWPAHSGQQGASKGKREDEGQRTAARSEPSPAGAGDGEAAEGKGGGEGKGKPDGFEPSPADANQGDGEEVKGEEVKVKVERPAGFKPSPADAEKLPQRSPIRSMKIIPRGWLRPTEALAQDKTPLALSLRGHGAAPRTREAMGAPPREVRVAGPWRKSVGLPEHQTIGWTPSGVRSSRRARGRKARGWRMAACATLAPTPPYMVAVAKPATPPRPRTPSSSFRTRSTRKWPGSSRRWMRTIFGV